LEPPPPSPVQEPGTAQRPEPAPERDPQPAVPPVDEPTQEPPRRDPGPDAPGRKAGADIDLTDALSQMRRPPAPAAPEPAATVRSLDDVLGARRTAAERQAGAQEAAEQLALGKTYVEMGMADEAIAALTRAVKIPTHRFEAASLLGRLCLQRGDAARAVEWLERAAEAPAPTAIAGRELLYDLGATLDATGEVSRALAVFMELQADAGDYRDVAARVERLARVQTGG
jgi:tetratricopeptide (TPR) repeat protein